LIELLIVVAVIAVIAAIAIPSLLRARISANEAATTGDIRTVMSAEAAYNSSNNNIYGVLSCLSTPSNAACLGSAYGSASPTFLDSQIAQDNVTKSGYERTANYTLVAGGVSNFCYLAQPIAARRTGVRSFGGDDSGVLAGTLGAVNCCAGAGPSVDTAACPAIK
jgi:type II secretory pathway pseudopilin PulG